MSPRPVYTTLSCLPLTSHGRRCNMTDDMLMCQSIALENLSRTIPLIGEDQKVVLLHSPFKGTTLFGGELAKLQKANTECASASASHLRGEVTHRGEVAVTEMIIDPPLQPQSPSHPSLAMVRPP